MFGQWVRGQLLLGLTVGVMTFIGLMFLSVTVDPIFGRYAVLLAVVAGILELLPVIGPIIAAVPAILLAATAGLEAVVAAFLCISPSSSSRTTCWCRRSRAMPSSSTRRSSSSR